MTSYMWREGALPLLSLILLLVVICARATPMPATDALARGQQELTTIETTLKEVQPQPQSQSPSQSHRIDCKLTFDATMDSLGQQQMQDNGCNVLHSSSTNKPADADEDADHELDHEQAKEQAQDEPASVRRNSMSGNSSGSNQPLYELQLVVWPSDIEVGHDIGSTTTSTTAGTTTTTPTPSPTTTTTKTTKTTTSTPAASTPSQLPLYEDQLVVFPQMDFEEENFDYFFDELEPAENASSTTSQPLASSTTTTSQPTAGPDEPQPVYVLENYRIKHANGTEEHKLVLSNGLVNYMKLYMKRVGDTLINVQEGYNSVPVAGQKPKIQTLYYIADERGYNVYRIEYGPPPTVPPTRVRYKATKSPQSKPNI
ncbi:mediator of RNA polymerase II transcription subunit 13 [Drosophila novamexicana]|uniref:mediator of RNA polymerase II transcription subunit 13 n=1 Tax=Drosophila novamexicana TaxID=47314 RepID=UPI0011E5FD66|nr:mediator of RNA polymerase II transcription subunit 13 [Drosophila novamexicana]